jgi:hypothetical protein
VDRFQQQMQIKAILNLINLLAIQPGMLVRNQLFSKAEKKSKIATSVNQEMHLSKIIFSRHSKQTIIIVNLKMVHVNFNQHIRLLFLIMKRQSIVLKETVL